MCRCVGVSVCRCVGVCACSRMTDCKPVDLQSVERQACMLTRVALARSEMWRCSAIASAQLRSEMGHGLLYSTAKCVEVNHLPNFRLWAKVPRQNSGTAT
eukprot:COSAG01_NODE_82_length_27810_cov_36.968352_3_plen_100_part_00